MGGALREPFALFVAQAIVILATSRAIGLVTRRVRQPMVIAEIVAGIALGPSLLGWLAPSALHTLFPTDSLRLLNLLAQVGLILFMFLVGLELDPKLLRGRGHTSVVISHSSIVVPFGLGALLALYLYPRLSDPAVPFSSFTLFMGVAMSITAFPVLARILVERRLMRTRVGAITIACAAVDDVTAWCILAFVVAVVRLSGVSAAIRTTGLTVAYALTMLFVVRPFLRRLSHRTLTKDGLSQNLVALILVLVLLSSWATELIGIHALFGAFVLGAVLPKENGFAQVLAEKLEDLVVVFFLPLFFAFSGLRTQIGLLDSADAWSMCGLVVLVACVGKFGGSAVAARATGMSWRDASAVGILMNTRGLMELVVLNIGLDLGVISPKLFTMMVIMALVTTFMTTPLLEWVYPMAELEKELAEPAPPTLVPTPTPTPAPAAGFTVLVCVAYERSGPAMVTLAGALLGTTDEANRLYALRLVRPADRASFVLDQREGAAREAVLGPALERGRDLHLHVRPLSFVSAGPADDICSVASVKQASLVVLGWHKPLLGNTVLSGTVHDVMRRAGADVAVFVDRGLTTIRRVLVPYVGSDHDRAALRLSRRIAQHTRAQVTVLHVVRPNTGDPRLGAQQEMNAVFREPGTSGEAEVRFVAVAHDEPGKAALEESRRGYDLVVVGIGAQWGLEHRSFGIQPETLIQGCPASLVVVRGGDVMPSPRLATAAAPAPRPSFVTIPERP